VDRQTKRKTDIQTNRSAPSFFAAKAPKREEINFKTERKEIEKYERTIKKDKIKRSKK